LNLRKKGGGREGEKKKKKKGNPYARNKKKAAASGLGAPLQDLRSIRRRSVSTSMARPFPMYQSEKKKKKGEEEV